MSIKYSLVLPVKNGISTLPTTMPYLLKNLDRDDIEIVVSDNHSDDGTYEYLKDLKDPRLKVFRPNQPVLLGENLKFAYSNAIGKWRSHFGDDDLPVPYHFKHFDDFEKKAGNIGVVRTKYVRYYWPDFKNSTLANTLDVIPEFTGKFSVHSGVDYARKMINTFNVYPGGCWFISSETIARMEELFGYFISPKHVEFYCARMACAVSNEVAELDLPTLIMGRHEKSTGTQVFSRKEESNVRDFTWDEENAEGWQHNPFNADIYTSLSYDAALKVSSQADGLCSSEIDHAQWIFYIFRDLVGLETKERAKPEWWPDFLQKLDLFDPEIVTSAIKLMVDNCEKLNKSQKETLANFVDRCPGHSKSMLELLKSQYMENMLLSETTTERLLEFSERTLNTELSKLLGEVEQKDKFFAQKAAFKNTFGGFNSSVFKHYTANFGMNNITDVAEFLKKSNTSLTNQFYSSIENVRMELPQIFFSIEAMYDVKCLHCGNVNIWPVLKFYIAKTIHAIFDDRLSAKLPHLPETPHSHALLNRRFSTNLEIPHEVESADTIVFSNANRNRLNRYQGKYFERLDPFYRALIDDRNAVKLEPFEKNSLELQPRCVDAYFFDPVAVQPARVSRERWRKKYRPPKSTISIYKNIIAYVKDCYGIHDGALRSREFEEILADFFRRLEFFDAFLARLKCGTIIFSHYGANLDGFAICCAGQNLKKRTIEVQHGLISPYNWPHCWGSLNERKLNAIPDEIWVWDEASAKDVRINDRANLFPTVRIVGNWMPDYFDHIGL